MIMNQKKKQFEKGSYDIYEYQFKLSIFATMHQIVSHNIVNTPIYCLLLTVEILQLMYYPVHPIIDFLWQNETLKGIQQFLQYFQFNYLIDQGLEMFIILLYSSFAIMLIYSSIFFVLQYKITKASNSESISSTQTIFLRFMSLFSIILNTIFTLPFYNIFLASLYCRSDSKAGAELNCYSGIQILHLCVAAIGIVLLLFFNITITLLYFDLNPKSKFPFSGFQSDAEYAKMFYKLVLPFLIIFNAPGNFNSEMIVLIGVGFLIILYFRYAYPSGYNNYVYIYKLILEITLVWEVLCVNITRFLDTGAPDDMGVFYLFILIPPIVAGGLYAYKQKTKEYLVSVVNNLKNEQEADNYIQLLIQLIAQRKEIEAKLKLYGILKLHYVNCNNKECPCNKLMKVDQKVEETTEISQTWMNFQAQVIQDIVSKYQDCPRFKIFYAYFANDELRNKYNSLHYMMRAEEKKADLREEFCLFRFKQHIEAQMIEEAEHQQDIDVNQIVYFEDQFVILTQLVEKSVDSHLEFWRELQEDNPNIIKLENIGIKVLGQIDQCEELFQELHEINASNLNLLDIYSNYLQSVVHDSGYANQLFSQMGVIKKSIFQRRSGAQDSKITDSQDTIIVTMSGNPDDLGTVFSCNTQVCKSLGYYATELVGQNISQIMPKSIGDYHNNLVQRFLSNSKQTVIGVERLVLASNKSQFLIPCKLMIKVLPNLDRGILIVGFLQPQQIDEGEYFMIYDPIQQVIQHYSQGMQDDFGLSFESIQQECSLASLFKELCDQLEQAQNGYGSIYKESEDKCISVEVDGQLVRQLKQEYMRESYKKKDQMLESSQLNHKLYLNKFKVKVQLLEERIFDEKEGSLTIHLVKLLLDNEGQDQFAMLRSSKQQRSKALDSQQMEVIEEKKQQEDDQDQPALKEEDQETEKHQKDIRDTLEEQKTPKQVIYLKYLTFFLFISTLALAITKLVLALQSEQLIQEGIAAIRTAQLRHSLMADINLYSRYLYLVSTGDYDSNLETPYKSNLSVLVDNLQKIQFDMIEFRIQIENRAGYSIDSDQYNITFLLTNNETKTYLQIFNDAIFAYITSASSFKKASIDQLTDSTSSVGKNFYYVIQNGLYVLRAGSEKIAQRFYNFYYDQLQSISNDSIAILASSLVVIVLCNLTYFPILLNVHQDAKKLLSIFGMIPNDDIKVLIDNGELYLKEYVKRYTEPGDEQADMIESQLQIESKSSIINPDQSQPQIEQYESPKQQEKLQFQFNQQSSQQENLIQRKSVYDIQNEKNNKMFNSKGRTHYRMIFTFTLLAIVLMVEFIVMYNIEELYVTNIQKLFKHYLYACQRSSIFKYNILFTLEQVVNDGNPILYDESDLSQVYNDRLIDNEQNLFKTLTNSYPGSFVDYFAYFNVLNYQNLCQNITWINDLSSVNTGFIFIDTTADEGGQTIFTSSDLQTECAEIKGGFLTKGLRDAMFLVALSNSEIISSFTSIENTFTSGAFQEQENLKKFIAPTQWESNNIFQSHFSDYLNESDKIQIYNFLAFIIFLIIVFLILWFAFIGAIKQNIYQSQQMLTLIPKDLIDKYSNIKRQINQELFRLPEIKQ